MSLRTDFTGALDTKLAEARANGRNWVLVDNFADITTQMAAAAAKGQKQFTLTFGVTYQTDDLRLEGCLWDAYKSGIMEGLFSEDVMDNEVNVVLNTLDTVSLRINLEFTF